VRPLCSSADMKSRYGEGTAACDQGGPMLLRVRVELGIPKLLVKINPAEATRISAKNLGEVLLKKVSAQRGHVAVLHMSRSVPVGELVMSLKLAEILDVEEEEKVELNAAVTTNRESEASSAPRVDVRSAFPARSSPTAAGVPSEARYQGGSSPSNPCSAPTPPASASTSSAFTDQRFGLPQQRRSSTGGTRLWADIAGVSSSRLSPNVDIESGLPTQDATPKNVRQTEARDPFSHASWPCGSWSSRFSSSRETGSYPSAAGAPKVPSASSRHPEEESSRTPFASSFTASADVCRGLRGSTFSSDRVADSLAGNRATGSSSPANVDLGFRSTPWQMAEELRAEESAKPSAEAPGNPWDAPTPQRAKHACGGRASGQGLALAESLEPSPVPSRAASRASSRGSTPSSSSDSARCRHLHSSGDRITSARNSSKKDAAGCSKTSQASSNVASSTTVSSPRDRRSPRDREGRDGDPDMVDTEQHHRFSTQHADVPVQEVSRPPGVPAPIVPLSSPSEAAGKASFARRQSGLLNKRHTMSFGALQGEVPKLPPPEPRQPVPSYWRGPVDEGSSSGLERSELGIEVTAEIRRWLLGETSGHQCSQVVLDRALTVLANFKLSSGCQLEVLGGPLGAIVGGYSDGDWLYDEVFQKQPAEALRDAFAYFGFRPRQDGDWSNVASEEVSLAYRRLCLRGHPSRGGSPRVYLKLQVAMELIRAFAGEAGTLDLFVRTPSSLRSATTPKSMVVAESGRDDFVLSDAMLVRELQLTASQAEEEATKISVEQLEEMNRALDEYILRQMCFKSEIVDEIARLHENCAYAILGVSADATDAEIKKAYRFIAMQCHPDKGGDKEDFQELNNAYEKIMEQRRSLNDALRGKNSDDPAEEDVCRAAKEPASGEEESEDAKKSKRKGSKEPKEDGGEEPEGGASEDFAKDEGEFDEEDESGAHSSNANLVEKATKAAEEASRYAKTAAEFAHQAAEAAETARRGREQGSREKLTKSIAHSAIVLTLTVVKAVRVVGYASLDVAAQCRIVAKRCPSASSSCSERGEAAMNLGMEALNAALACAEVTETTASELQGNGGAEEESSVWPAAAAERFVGAAVKASLSAASASNAAMSAAIAAVEGSRDVAKAVEEMSANNGKSESSRNQQKEAPESRSPRPDDEADEDGELPEIEMPPQPPSAEEVAAASMKRLVAQRNNNHKVLQRLNAEILSHQENVRSFLQCNRALIPNVSGEEKTKVFRLLTDFAAEARAELETTLSTTTNSEKLLEAVRELQLLLPFVQPQALAISVSVKARVLKMAALYDITATMKILDAEIFQVIRRTSVMEGTRKKIDDLHARVKNELLCNVAESSPVHGERKNS